MSFGWSWHALFVVGFANCVREHPSVGAWALPLGVFTFEASLLLWVVELPNFVVALGKGGPFYCRNEELRMPFIFFFLVIPDNAAAAVVSSEVSLDV